MFHFIQKIKSSNVIVNYSKMYPFVRPYLTRAILAILITIPVGGMDAIIAWALKPYMDVVLIEKNVSATVYLPLLIIAFSLVQSILNYLAGYLNGWVGRKINNELQITLYEKLVTYDAAFFDKNTSGYIFQRFAGDVASACTGLLTNIKDFTTRIFSSLALVGVLIYNSWQLSLVAIVFLIGAFLPTLKIRKRIKNIVTQTVTIGGELTTYYNETYQGNRIIASYNLAKIQADKFRDVLTKSFKLGTKMVQRTGFLSPFMHFAISLGIAFVIWYGSYLIVTKQITPGNFVSFITALVMLYNPVKSIGNKFNAVQVSLMAMDRVFELLEQNPAIVNPQNAKPLKEVRQGIEFRDVNFEYVEGKPVLKNINLKVKMGETTAFVGNSGGGKTTLVNLLPRFYDVKSGAVLIDGTDVREIDLYDLRDKIAVVFQDNFLFSGTIRENILLGKPGASEEEIWAAVRSSCLEDFVKGLEQGLDTEIGERGVLLSGGQKQRIAIARAFVKNAPIVILDEATSALDNKSERVVQEAIENLMANRTVLVIAHRLSTVRNADKIVVVNDGELVESGTHDELIAKEGGIYASLYNTQLK